MQKFLFSRDLELTTNDIARIIMAFQQENLPTLKHWHRYYEGDHKILHKRYSDPNKPISRIVVNFPKEITNQYSGYIIGQPIKYIADEVEPILDILNYNDVHNQDSEWLTQALQYGVGYCLNYIDLEGRQRFKVLDTREVIPVYSNDIEEDLLYCIRFWEEETADKPMQPQYYIEVYAKDKLKKYKSQSGFNYFELIGEEPNFFKQVPITPFKLNPEEESIYAQVITLVDAYEELVSSQLDDYSAFVQAYLILKGAIADDDELASMKENRVLLLDTDAEASYLTKDINNTPVKEMLENYKEQIYNKTNCPDYTKDTFNAETGIAIRYKLIQLDNAVASIESQFKKALQRRIELICNILYLTGNEEAWRDIDIVFTKNLPDTLMPSSIQEVISLKGLVSDETLLGLLPFIKNVDDEIKKVVAQNEANMALYNFVGNNEDEQLLEE